MNCEQLHKIRNGTGFIAALDQSGGSTPQALQRYGIDESAYSSKEAMFTLVHEMRSRIVTSSSFTGDRIIGAILFEETLDRQFDGCEPPDYLWRVKGIVPLVKVDQGLTGEADGVQTMKPMTRLAELLDRAAAMGVFGTKMRSTIKLANPTGIEAVVEQQFAVARQIRASGLVPIIEPEIDINSPQKPEAEAILRTMLLEHLGQLDDEVVMLKLTLPTTADFYADLVTHPNVLRVLALSGGHSRDLANRLLAHNHAIIASFSRALQEGLTINQSTQDFEATLEHSIASIFEASTT